MMIFRILLLVALLAASADAGCFGRFRARLHRRARQQTVRVQPALNLPIVRHKPVRKLLFGNIRQSRIGCGPQGCR